MSKITHIVAKALQNAGIWISESDPVPGDYLGPCHVMLQDIVAELNAQSAIIFRQEVINTPVIGDRLTFKPLTVAERAAIAAGETVDLSDRLTEFVPIQYPTGLSVAGQSMRFVSISDLALGVRGYAFQTSDDSTAIVFPEPLEGKVLKCVVNVPIAMDPTPVGEVHVPPAYEHMLVTRLAEAAALRYQFADSASLFAQKGRAQANALANNATSMRPLPHNTARNLNRFR